MKLPDNTPWFYQSVAPYLVERMGAHEDPIGEHGGVTILGFEEAMGAFWVDIGRPSVRAVYDAYGKCIIGQVCGSEVDMLFTFEAERWCARRLPPEVYATFAHIPHCYRLINNQEDH